MYINNSKNTFKGISTLAKPLSHFYNPNAILPVLIIESGVTLGRSAMASKRGGKMEASERFVEQGASAVVWLWGVQTLKKIGDTVGEKLFKHNLNFDVGFDYLRNPIKNNNINKLAKSFKVTNMLISTALATLFIGFILPKINHKISERFVDKQEKKYENLLKPISFEEFKNSNVKAKYNKNISFSSLAEGTLYFAHLLENDQTARLFITDTGVVAGRYKNSRNKYEKIESLFRDISSIYFYLFSTNHFVKLMNKFTKNTDIDPTTLKCVKEELSKQVSKGFSNVDLFKEKTIGKVSEKDLSKLKKVFVGDKKTIKVEDFIKLFSSRAKKAMEMVKLQPIFTGKGVLSYREALDVLSTGSLSNPKFLRDTMAKATKGASIDKLRFIRADKLDKIRNSIDVFAMQVAEYAKAKNLKIDKNLIEKITNKNIRKNFAFYSIGTGISILFLSYVIPKVQYFITKQLTHQDKFPGAY